MTKTIMAFRAITETVDSESSARGNDTDVDIPILQAFKEVYC